VKVVVWRGQDDDWSLLAISKRMGSPLSIVELRAKLVVCASLCIMLMTKKSKSKLRFEE
jgi:hypothetical protein